MFITESWANLSSARKARHQATSSLCAYNIVDQLMYETRRVVMGDTQNFIHDKYRERISRYSIYRDTDLWPSTYFITHRRGGVDNLLYYVLYKGRVVFANAKNCQKMAIFALYNMWTAPFES